MASGIVGGVVRDFGRLFAQGSGTGLSEGQLLERAVDRGDEACLRSLVERHGPMVLGVCRHLLQDPNDVDDAFQATFLVLVRRAQSLHRRDQLGGWLYGVAVRVAKRARITAAKRLPRERALQEETIVDEGSAEPSTELESSEIRRALHDEIARLPESYRQALVLCYLEGQSHDEAAQSLGWPVGTVKGRLSRARDLLRDRLTRRGFASAGAATLLMAGSSKASVPASLIASTTTSALGLTARAIAATGAGATASGAAVALMEGALHTMSLTQIKFFGSAITAFGLFAAGSAVMTYGDQDPGGASTGSSTAIATQPARSQASSNSSSPTTASSADAVATKSTRSQATNTGSTAARPLGVPAKAATSPALGGTATKSSGSVNTTSFPGAGLAPVAAEGRGVATTTASDPVSAGAGFGGSTSVATTTPGMSTGGAPAATAAQPATSEAIKLARTALADLEALRQSGRASTSDPAFLTWSRRLLDAQLANNPTREQRISAAKEYLERIEKIAEISKLQFERGQKSKLEQREGEFMLLEAQRLVMEASAPGGSTRPAAASPLGMMSSGGMGMMGEPGGGLPGASGGMVGMGGAPSSVPRGAGVARDSASTGLSPPVGTAASAVRHAPGGMGRGVGGEGAMTGTPAGAGGSSSGVVASSIPAGGGGFGGGGAAVATGRSRLASPVPNPADEPRNAAILKKLESPVDLKFESTPFAEVIKYVKEVTADKSGKTLPIYVDPIGLEESAASMESAITIELEDIPLRTALRLILSQLNLEYSVADGVLFITSPPTRNEQ